MEWKVCSRGRRLQLSLRGRKIPEGRRGRNSGRDWVERLLQDCFCSYRPFRPNPLKPKFFQVVGEIHVISTCCKNLMQFRDTLPPVNSPGLPFPLLSSAIIFKDSTNSETLRASLQFQYRSNRSLVQFHPMILHISKYHFLYLFQITFSPLEFILVHITLPHPSFFIYAAKAAMHVVTKRCKYTDLPKQHSL